MKLNFCN